MSRTKFMGIFLVILGVISVVVGIIRGDMTSSAVMFIGYLVPALLGAVILIVDHTGGGESKTETVNVTLIEKIPENFQTSKSAA